MENNELSRSIASAAEGTKNLMQGSIVITIGMNFLISLGISQITMLINSMQLIFHLPIFSIIPPGNVLTMFKIMIPVVMFDIMESMTFFQDLFPDSESDMRNNGG